MNNETFWKNIEGEKWLERNNNRHKNDSSHELNYFYDLIDKYNLKTDKILYIGCSDGTKINFIKSRYKNSSCYGIDVSEYAISRAKSKFKDINFHNLSAYNLDFFDNNMFDLVIYGFCSCYFNKDKLDKISKDTNNILKKMVV